ncbi:prefoldin subunit alpha [Halorubrum sp. AJ67]|uniref:prefoldin subunit alpha n=1 Tax=Halorubrum sp. AJ67 TaxID=1173487 RepID=UPI0003DD43A3|nr:prefoldin subunit alpha [Halorubrum sp. AJ67]CDK38873.1 prefoldin, alpha subunit [Halorubrum sp. AJ67]
MGGGQQQLQQLSQELQALDEEIEELEAEIADLREEQADIDDAVEAIETLDTGAAVQVPLGGGAYLRAEVQDIDEVIVSLGGNYSAEQEQDDAIDVLRSKQESLDERIEETEAEVDELESESDELEQQAQQMQQQMQQQQMQQMQAQEEDGE